MQQAADLRRAFAAFDVNGDGEISRQEFRDIMARKSDLPHQQSVAKADAIFDDFDTNNDGSLQVSECEAALAYLAGKSTTAVAVPAGASEAIVSKLDFWLMFKVRGAARGICDTLAC